MDETRIALLRSMGYSEKAIELISRNANLGEIENPTVTSKHSGTCGDVMILYLTLENGIVKDAKYQYVGCAGLQSTGAGLVEMIKGQPLAKIEHITAADIINYLESIPAAKYECAKIAQNALHKALENYREKVSG
ncbi:hypothetical protein B1H10_08490 [candidate division KSB1 bacterium 4484_188]|nr:MAG: hypothetical protein B1H10_08490 [candidate division KSB1 bacterium 4484_188]HFE65331.1 hypothetical protein [Caldithrix sp.]